jgi:hypothetical protein
VLSKKDFGRSEENIVVTLRASQKRIEVEAKQKQWNTVTTWCVDSCRRKVTARNANHAAPRRHIFKWS